MKIKGISGKIKASLWHTGDSARVNIYNQSGDSIYFVLSNTNDIDQFVSTLGAGFGQIKFGRACADITTLGETVQVSAYDFETSYCKRKAWFHKEQITKIIRSLNYN